jgi:hypothetical protein
MFEYIVTIEGHRIVALIDQFGVELSRFYIDGELCDTYDADNFNPWKDDELWPGLLFAKVENHPPRSNHQGRWRASTRRVSNTIRYGRCV